MRISNTNKLRTLAIINHLALLIMVIREVSYFFLFIGYLIHVLSGLSITIGYHRYWAHKSFQINKFYEIILMLLGTITSLGPILAWAGIHRKHHLYEDTDKDPHSPQKNFFKSYFHIWTSYNIEKSLIKDLISNSICKFQYKFYFIILFSYIALMFLFFRESAVFLYCFPAVLAFHSVGIVNSLNHSFGSKIGSTSSATNLPILNFLTLGESYHANHHADQKNYDFGNYDFAKYIIRAIRS